MTAVPPSRLATPGLTAQSVSSRVLIIDGHPRADSLCAALAAAYRQGAAASGHEVQFLALRDLDFDLHERGQPANEAILRSQHLLQWASHIAIISPVWWGSVPSLLKGWLDRVLQPEFAFRETEDGRWEGLLKGRTAQLIITLDTPLWIFRFILKAPAVHALRDATLKFCGITPVAVLLLTRARHTTPILRQTWLDRVETLGTTIERDFHTGPRPKFAAWLRIARLQFYFFPALALTVGVLAAQHTHPQSSSWPAAFLAWLGILLVEFVTVLTNEIHDLPSDSANRNSGPFNGGSRVLVEGKLSLQEVRRGRRLAGAALALAFIALSLHSPQFTLPLAALLTLGLTLGMGYSAPPLKLAYRGLGELTVAFTNGALVVLAGYLSQGGRFAEATPWIIILPMFAAIMPSIILAGFPDSEADMANGKGTLAVRLGKQHAAWLALAFTIVAAVASIAIALAVSPILSPPLISAAIILHAVLLSSRLFRLTQQDSTGRIDALLILSLTYMIWFALGPLWRFWP